MSIEELTKGIAALHLKIQGLKNDQDQVENDVEKKINILEQIECLREEKKDLEKRVQILKEKDRDTLLEKKFNQLREQMEEKMQLKLNDLQIEVRDLQVKTADLDTYKKKVDDLEKSMEVIQLGQLFARYMEAIYREILEEYFLDKDGNFRRDYPQPRLRKMLRNIEEFCPERQEEKKEHWRQKKQLIGYDFAKFMEDISPQYIIHIYEEILPQYFLDQDGRPKRKFQQPSVTRIEEDIKNTYSRTKRKEREEMWKAKQEEIASTFFDYMEKMMDERNGIAHPNPLEERELRKIAELMIHPDKSYVEHAIGQLKNTYSYVWGQYFTPLY